MYKLVTQNMDNDSENEDELKFDSSFFEFKFLTDLFFEFLLRVALEFSVHFVIFIIIKLGNYFYKIYINLNKQKILDCLPTINLDSETKMRNDFEDTSTNDDISNGTPSKDNQDNNHKNNALAQREHKTQQDCMICLTDINSGKQLYCGHIFHKSCLEEFLMENANLKCPICGFVISVTKIDFSELKRKHPFHLQLLAEQLQLLYKTEKIKLSKFDITDKSNTQY